MKGGRIIGLAAAAAAVTAAVLVITSPSDRGGRPTAVRSDRDPIRLPATDAAGVCVLSALGEARVRGTLFFRPKGLEVEISGTLEGLPPGEYRFEISEFGDARGVGSGSLGGLFLSQDRMDRLPADEVSLDRLMSFEVDPTGIARLSRLNPALTLYGPDSLIGRAFVLYGRTAATSGDGQIAFGVIGRANPGWTPSVASPLTGHGEGSSDRC